MFKQPNDDKFQWNKEEVSNVVELPSQDHGGVVEAAQCYNIAISGKVTLQSLEEAPFSSLPIDTLNQLRDDAYNNGVFHRRKSQLGDQQAVHLCQSELVKLCNLSKTYGKLHRSAFRKLVLISLYSPFCVMTSITTILVQSDPVTSRSALLCLVLDATAQFGNMLSYKMDKLGHLVANSSLTLVVAVLGDVLLTCASSQQSTSNDCESVILHLIQHWLAKSYFSHHACVQHLINPLLHINHTSTAVKVFLCASEVTEIKLTSTLNETISQILHKLCDALHFQLRKSFHYDAQFSELDFYMTSFQSLVKLIPTHIVKSCLLAQSESNHKHPWLVYLLIYQHLSIEASRHIPNPVKVKFKQLAEQQLRSNDNTCIESHEQLIILCATAPTFALLTDNTDFELGDLVEKNVDLEIGKWLAALVRQLWLLTPEELERLFSKQNPLLGHKIIPTLSNGSYPSNRHILLLQLGLQAAGLLLLNSEPVSAQYESQRRYINAAVRVCRAICTAVKLTMSGSERINVAERVEYVSVLIRFCVGQYNEGWQNNEIYGPCTDLVTMTLLNCIQHAVQMSDRSGSREEVKQLNDMIESINSRCTGSHAIRSAALCVLESSLS